MEISKEDQDRITAAIRAAEVKTSGEIICVLAKNSSDHATALPVVIAAVLSLALPWILMVCTSMSLQSILSLQVLLNIPLALMGGLVFTWWQINNISIATLVGFIYAFALSRLDRRLRGALRLIALLPLFSPPFTLGFSYLLMFGRYGLITHGLAGLEVSILGWGSLWAVQTLTYFPIAALAIERILNAAPAQLEIAARNLGAGGLAVFTTVTLPCWWRCTCWPTSPTR